MMVHLCNGIPAIFQKEVLYVLYGMMAKIY